MNSPIFNFFQDLDLTNDQADALLKIEEFLNSDQQIFILKGYAGTGKTTILKGLSNYLKAINRLGHIMAPTGRAAMVIKNKTKYKASTIHRHIYDLEKIKTEKNIDKDGNETFKFYFDYSLDVMDINKVAIFDESSMISNTYSDGEFFRFGSGYLLNDILSFFNPNSKRNTKIIFVGDPAQLPPVGSNTSLALESSFFKEKDLLVDEIEMTQVVRQREGSGILANAKYYRELIFKDVVSENNLNTDFEDVEEISITDVAKIYTDSSPLPNSKNCMIITFSNSLAKTYNDIIREQYFPEDKNVVAGDILQIVKNNYSSSEAELLNGDFVKVLEVTKNTSTQSAIIKKKGGEDVLISFEFRLAKIKLMTGEEIKVALLDTLLNNKNRGLTSDETKALYINFIMRYKDQIGGGKIDKSSKEFKESFRKDPYFNVLHVKFGYAITGHKSQGGEWNNVIVNFDGRVGISKDVLRWSYTTITRAANKLYVLQASKLQQIDFSKLKNTAIGKIKKAPKGAIYYPVIKETPFHKIDSHPAKRQKYFELLEVLESNNYKITTIISNDYLEKYTVSNGENSYTIDLNHNSEGTFSSYRSTSNNEETTRLISLMKEVRPWPYNFNYKTEDPFLEKIYQTILAAIEGLEIQIININDSTKIDFHVNYYFRTKAEIAYLQIYFNKNEVVSNVIAKSMLGEDDTILRKVINNLKNNG